MTTWAAIGSALWLGIMTSISPCPLASNIAAISFVSRKIERTGEVLLSGLLYTVGRVIAYAALAAVLVAGLTASAQVSLFLQRYLNQLLGPVLILVGLILLGLLGEGLSFNLAGTKMQERLAGRNVWWSIPLGILFALSFCPVSAGLFFGGLVPLAAAKQSRILLPVLFGVGTALPVLAFAFLIAFAGKSVGKAFNRLQQIEFWVRHVTGVIFVVAGIYYCLIYIYEIHRILG